MNLCLLQLQIFVLCNFASCRKVGTDRRKSSRIAGSRICEDNSPLSMNSAPLITIAICVCRGFILGCECFWMGSDVVE